jgi:hypothetical protein
MMALSSGFFSDSGMSSPLTITEFEQLEDGSSSPGLPSPADRVVYFGLPDAAKQIQALSDPGVDPIVISIVTNVAAWQASTTSVSGDIVQPSTANGYKYEAQSNGASDTAEPTWPTTIGATVVDNEVTWRCIDEIHQGAEIRLATSQAGLDSATPGDSLSLAASIAGGTAIPIWMRVSQGVHPAHASVFYDLKLETVELTEPVI